jgi:hypothetical protein
LPSANTFLFCENKTDLKKYRRTRYWLRLFLKVQITSTNEKYYLDTLQIAKLNISCSKAVTNFKNSIAKKNTSKIKISDALDLYLPLF